MRARSTCRRRILQACLSVLFAVCAQAQAPELIRPVHEQALENPFDDGVFRRYLATLPKDAEYYVVEGDLLMTEPEVRAYLVASSKTQTRAGIRPELLVNLHDGARDYYRSMDDRRLSYYVDRSSFNSEDRFQRVKSSLEVATSQWMKACPECGIKFIEAEQPPSGDAAKTGFVVRQHDAGGSYLAAAFFPHDPPARRVLRVEPSLFQSSVEIVGIMQHEIGHVLGYRHEHIRGIPGCTFEDRNWRPLTPYDPRSVMHYLCGGGGSKSMYLTEVDVAGHRALYGAPRSALILPTPAPVNQAGHALQRFEEARRNPFDESKRRAYLDGLPRIGEYFVVEGDLRMTEHEVIGYLAATGQDQASVERTPELAVNVFRGALDFYPPERRKLPYVIDKASFPSALRYDEARRAMKKAADDWEALCGSCDIAFKHLEEFDERPAAANANFVMRHVDAGGRFVAIAFFPHDPPARRVVEIDPSFFSSPFDKAGVLRHELGHVLGYRHEHIRGVNGCYQEGNDWKPLTPYDPKSVMHYFCGGGGNMKLEFSQFDRTGHYKLYAPFQKSDATQSSPPKQRESVLVVSLEGGEVVDNAASVLRILHDLDLVQTTTHVVKKGDFVETIYRERLNLPAWSSVMNRLANELNHKRYETEPLSINEKVEVPAVTFSEARWGIVDDASKIAEIERNWKHVLASPAGAVGSDTGGSRRIELKSYKLRVPSTDTTRLIEARDRIRRLKSENIVAGVDTPPQAPPKYFSLPPQPAQRTVISLDKLYSNRSKLARGEQGSVLSLLGQPEISGKRVCSGVNCPEIVLLDKPLMTHPDLKGAIPREATGPADPPYENEVLVNGEQQLFEVADWDIAYHGTHLAGIIASRDNEFGLLGVDPEVRITPWNWDELSTKTSDVVPDKVYERQIRAKNTGAFQIYVFATSWPTGPWGTPEERVKEDALAKGFDQQKPLVIAAAGEADRTQNQKPQQINFATRQAPMNLGDLPNVVVVTGCWPCVEPAAGLLPDANYSPEFVHVAAPARDVLSTAFGARYALGSGTSQATAFVAGLASAMVARFPDSYKSDHHQVKLRLQVTSTPIELIGNVADGRKLAAGVVDPALATRDPKKHWLKPKGASDFTGYDTASWNVEHISIVDDTPRRTLLQTDEIWRVSTRAGKSVVYLGPGNGPIRKIGPGVLKTADATKPVLRADTTDVMLSQIEDLVLKYPVR